MYIVGCVDIRVVYNRVVYILGWYILGRGDVNIRVVRPFILGWGDLGELGDGVLVGVSNVHLHRGFN